MFLIDTVTLSELRQLERDPSVVRRFERQRSSNLFLSVVSIGKIERGVAPIQPQACGQAIVDLFTRPKILDHP